MRTAKLKTAGNMAASIEHTLRERDTPNADPKKTHLNVHHGPSTTQELLDKVTELLPDQRRKDAVLCIEHFVGASPEWWQEATPEQQQQFFERSEKWLHEIYGKENVAYFGTQMDEKTPHAVAYVVPIKDGKLNAKAWLGGKERLQALQGSFAASVKDLGLTRGIEGSTAKHERVQRFYGALERADQVVEHIIGQAELKIGLSDRAAALSGKMPPSVSQELERTHDLATKARQVIQTEGPRREAAGYQRGLKDIPQQQADLVADRERLRKERERVEFLDERMKVREAELEKSRSEFVKHLETHSVNLMKNLGLTLAGRGAEYVGELASVTAKFAIQATVDVGLVLHQIASWTGEQRDKLLGHWQRDEPVTINYDRRGGVELGRARGTDLERHRDLDRGFERGRG